MARIRTIKPEFWQDEDLASVSETARLLAIGLLNLSDDEGYFKANPKLIQSQIFPLTEPSLSIHVLLTDLSNIGYILLFEGEDGKAYGRVLSFLKHQAINRPTQSKIKHLQKLTERSLSTHGTLTAGKEGKGKEGKGMEWNAQSYYSNIIISVDPQNLKEEEKQQRFAALEKEMRMWGTWHESVCMATHKTAPVIKKLIIEFLNNLKADDDYFKDLNEVKKHFRNWANKQAVEKQSANIPAI